jgi:glycosyltransferase involved in cell wall biosynthesis
MYVINANVANGQFSHMINLCFLIRSLDVGGAEVQLCALARGLDPSRYKVTVLCFYPGGALAGSLQEAGVDVICLNKRGRWDLLSFAVRLVTALRQLRPDILHSYMGPANLLAIVVKPFLRRTKIIWGIRASDMNLAHYDYSWRLTFGLECRLSKWADLVIANSWAGRDHHVAAGFPDERTIVIANGIDADRFRPDPAAGRQLRLQWGVPETAILIGQVARLDPMKDYPNFLRAAAALAAERDDVWFVCVGDGAPAYAAELRELATSLGLNERLLWLGGRDDMPAVFDSLQIVTSSSAFGEGFSNALGEAMSSGVPCVATDVGDAALVLGGLGQTVPRGAPELLLEGWRALLARPSTERQELGRTCRARIVEKFSLPAMVAESDRVYQWLANP